MLSNNAFTYIEMLHTKLIKDSTDKKCIDREWFFNQPLDIMDNVVERRKDAKE